METDTKQSVENQAQDQAGGNKASQSTAVASLVLGIVALLSDFLGIGSVIGLILGIIGWVLGAKARKALPPGETAMATAGWICSIIAVLGALFFMFVGVSLLGGIGLSLF